MSATLHGPAYRLQKQQHEGKKQCRRKSQRSERGRVHLIGITVTLMVGKTEEPCLHAIGKDNQRERHNGVDISDHSIHVLGKQTRVKRDETPVEKAPHDRTDTIYSGVLCQ